MRGAIPVGRGGPAGRLSILLCEVRGVFATTSNAASRGRAPTMSSGDDDAGSLVLPRTCRAMKSRMSRRRYRTDRPSFTYLQPVPLVRSRSMVRSELLRSRAYSAVVRSSSRFSMLAPSGRVHHAAARDGTDTSAAKFRITEKSYQEATRVFSVRTFLRTSSMNLPRATSVSGCASDPAPEVSIIAAATGLMISTKFQNRPLYSLDP